MFLGDVNLAVGRMGGSSADKSIGQLVARPGMTLLDCATICSLVRPDPPPSYSTVVLVLY